MIAGILWDNDETFWSTPSTCSMQPTGNCSQCVVVEDSPRGRQAAPGAGIECIVLRGPLTRQCRFDGACRVVDSVDELAGEVAKLL